MQLKQFYLNFKYCKCVDARSLSAITEAVKALPQVEEIDLGISGCQEVLKKIGEFIESLKYHRCFGNIFKGSYWDNYV